MKNSMCILLPGRLNKPVGGHKVIYQYSNYLADSGWDIIIANSVFLPSNENRWIEFLRKTYAIIRQIVRYFRKQNTCTGWFPLNKRVKEIAVWSYSACNMPKTDYYLASDAITAPYLLQYDVPEDNKIYFIQGYENWRLNDDQLKATYHIPAKRIVISTWLQKILINEGVSCELVPNGIDFREYFLSVPISEKDNKTVSMLYHTAPMKNVNLGFEALNIVHQQIPDLKVLMFGVYSKPDDLPSWYNYYQCPDIQLHNAINNQAAIFIGTSDLEGWGLPILEAMACGQAVACTDNKGYLEIAQHEENALVSKVGDAESLARNILTLISNDDLREFLALAGHNTAQHYSLSHSCKDFAECL